jgi:fructose-1,6-bisphosphatase I / sedoheptulose-1,7-bisphosphatase
VNVTLRELLHERRGGAPGEWAPLGPVLSELASAFATLSATVARAALAGAAGDAGTSNSGGERQKKLDVIANELLVGACARSRRVAALASEEMESPLELRPRGAELLVAVDPLDGSSNLDVNVTVGSIFSVLRRSGAASPAELLRPGLEQVCAGYAIYGPTTMLVLTLGRGVHGFTLDRRRRAFVLTHPDLRVPPEAREFAVNASNERFWEPPVRRYVSECLAGRTGPRGDDFNMRWIASLVAEVHRILIRGGVFLYPRDTKRPPRAGRLRLLYEASPMAFLVEQAGGTASTGRERLLEVVPESLHARVPVVLGSSAEVERIVRYHREHDASGEPFRDPLFNTRCLFASCEAREASVEQEAPCR